MAEFEGNATYSCEIKVLFHFMSFPVLPSIIKYMLQLQTVQFALTLTKRIEFIIEWNLLEKEYETAILLYCFHTAGVIHIFWALDHHFIEILKLILKENKIRK